MKVLIKRAQSRWQRASARWCFRRERPLDLDPPLVSFTFDDFPTSALELGGAILERHGAAGTYYAALGLMGEDSPSGRIFGREHLEPLVAAGHELGCHTFAHCHAWQTPPGVFEASVHENQKRLDELIPGTRFSSFSYPLCCPRPLTKRRMGRLFDSCRGGGQTANVGRVDLNHVQAFFIEKSRARPEVIKALIDATCEQRGWLVLATHDIAADPSPFGCTPELLEELVTHALSRDAAVVTVREAVARLSGHPAREGAADSTRAERSGRPGVPLLLCRA